jgi:hypothetical protein
MPLEIKKIYIDSRFKTYDSRSDSDFYVELAKSCNIPDNCVAYIDDFVIPVSWSTVSERNNKLYMYLDIDSKRTTWSRIITIPSKNYTGISFAAALEKAINDDMATFYTTRYKVDFELVDNQIIITQTNNFHQQTTLVSSADLLAGKNWETRITDKSMLNSMNGILRIGKRSALILESTPYSAYLDLFTVRNLYLTSSALASYTNVSNFGNDLIVKKIPINAGFGQMLFYNAGSGYDYLDVSKRQLNRLDFRLQDSFGNVVDLRGNHWSFSIVFQIRD